MARSTTAIALFLSAALLGAPEVRGDDLATWDQEKVTAIAQEIVESSQVLRRSLRKQPPPTLGQPGRRAFWVLRDELQGIESTARRLHSALAQGDSREQTHPIYRRLLMGARRAAAEVRRLGLVEPAIGKIDATADAIRRIRPFYEEEPPI